MLPPPPLARRRRTKPACGCLPCAPQAANPGLNPATLSVGSYVKLPDWADSCPNPGNSVACRYYVAEAGDSLAAIAQAFVAPLGELQALNGNTEAAVVLQPGQRIFLPPFDAAACGDGVQVSKPSGCRAYQVVAGDTLFDIATKVGGCWGAVGGGVLGCRGGGWGWRAVHAAAAAALSGHHPAKR